MWGRERAVVSHERAIFVQIPLMLRILGVGFRFVLSKQFVDVSTYAVFR